MNWAVDEASSWHNRRCRTVNLQPLPKKKRRAGRLELESDTTVKAEAKRKTESDNVPVRVHDLTRQRPPNVEVSPKRRIANGVSSMFAPLAGCSLP